MPKSGNHNVNNIDSFFRVRPSKTNIREGETVSFLEDGVLVKQEKRNGVVYEQKFTELASSAKVTQTTGDVTNLIVAGSSSSEGDVTGITAGTGLSGGGSGGNITLNIDSTVTTLTGTQTLTNKTLTAPTLTTPALGTPASGVMTNVTGTAANLTTGKVTVTDSTANTNFPVIFHDESNALLDDTSALTYNPSSGTLVVPNLNVSGTTTTVDTTNLVVSDKLIELSNGATGTPAAEADSGLIIERGSSDNVFIGWDEGSDRVRFAITSSTGSSSTVSFSSNANIQAGRLYGDVTGDVTGNADTATTLATNRAFSLTGDVTASGVNFNGSAAVELTTTIAATSVEGSMLNDNVISGQGALGSASVAQADLFMMDDGPGTLKKVTFSNLEDSIFGNVSGDATIAAGGALTIAANSVEGTMLNTNAADTSTLELSSDTLSVLKVPNALTAGTGITAAGTFDGAAARTVSITPAQTAITSIINTSLRMGRAADSEYIDFGTDNEVRIAAGNVTFMKFIDDTQDKIIVGDGSSDIDFIVDDNSGNAAFTVQSSDGAVTIPGALTVGSIGGVTNYIGTNVIANTYKYNNSGSAGATAFTIGATGGVEFTQAISLANADFASTSSDGPVVSLKSNITNEDAVNFLGRINFSAPVSGSSGDDSRLLAASIVAQKSATFSSTSNQTDMIFELGVSEVASEKFRILSDGKIKIGNAYTLPAADGSANQILKTNGSGTVSFAAESTPAVTSYTNTGDNRVLTSVGGTTINGEANLTFDGTLLHISKETSTSASSTGTTLFKITNDVGADLNQQKTFVDFTLLDDNANETPQVRIGAEVGHNGDANTQEKEGSGAFVVYTNNADTTSGDAGASLAERMRVDYQGNVGIGTTSPTYELDVAGDIGVDHVIYHNDDTNTYHQFTNDRQRFFAGGELLLDLFEGTQDYVKLGDGGDVDINLNDDMFIQGSSSNVGIGTTSPGANLDVAGSGGTDGAAGSPTLRLSNTVDSTDWDTGDVVGTLEYYAQDPSGNAPYVTSFIKSVNGVDGSNGTLPSGALTFGVASYNLSGGAVEKMRIDSTGNVGIGTISPSHEMVLRKDQAAETELSIVNLTSNSSAKTNLRFRNATSGSETGNGALIQLTNGNDFKILNQFGNNLILGTSNAEKMRINSSGNVGIGVTNPDSPLHIGNNVATSAGFDSFADYQILLYDTGTSTTSYGMGIRANTFMFNSDVDYEWRSDNSAKMFLDGANGRLGIGTTSPSYKLDVAGDIKTTAHLVLPYGEINDAGTDMNIVSTNALTLGTESGTALTLANASTVVAIANKMTLPASHSADKITMYSGGNEKIGTEANTLLFTADNYKFKDTAGHDNLFMNNSGNVGIGDNNPPNKLSVKGSSTDLLYLEGDGITSNSIIQSATGGSTRIRSAGGKIEFYTDGSANSSSASGADFAMVVNASQNVGIGTGSPSHKVHIDSNGSTNSVLRIDADDARGANRYALDVQDDDGNRRGVARFRHTTGSGNPPILIAEGYDHAYIFQSKNTSASDAEQFRIEHFDGNVRINSLRGSLAINEESGQNVGIGTSSPDTTLDVTAGGANGVVINQDSNDATNSSRMFFKNSSGTYSMYKVGDYLRVNSGATAGSSSGGTNLISIGSNVGIGATNPATKLCVRSTATFNTSIEYDASTRLRIGVAGSGVATFTTDNNAACAFTKDVVAFATSDKRLKDNIKPLDNAIDKVLKISGVEFDWNDTRDEDGKPLHSYEGHDVGVIAQEIEEVLPEVVTTRDNGYKAVKYEKIVPLLIEAIKEQQVQIDELKTKIGEQNG